MWVKNLNIRITDLSGRAITGSDYSDMIAGKYVLQIPLSELGNLQKGVYVIQINVDSRNFSKKLVVNW